MFPVKTIMTTKPITVSKDTNIYEAIRIMVDNNVTGLPVVNVDGELVGIVSEKDVLKLMYNLEDKPGNVENYMTKSVICFDHNDSLIDIAECFIKHHFRRVPILAQGKLVGIISRKDIIAYILTLRRQNNLNV